MILGNETRSATPSGYKVAPMSYAKLEDVAERLRPLLPTVAGSGGNRVDAWRTLEITLRKAGYEYRSEETASLEDCAAFTIPERRLIVLREDVYDGVTKENVFSRSTVFHELSHIVLEHAVTLQRGPIGQHRFFEDSEWQAKALTVAIMMPLAACRSVASALDLAQLCGTSVQAATYRLDRLTKDKVIPAKAGGVGLFD
ncbi:MAG: neutral zinc metallopeptidase [Burkholderiaceae bacterium]|nr:neutral zinc metallopeptidase [Burkholderiaceae bacterium]